jgi:hypothetical protein
MGRPIDLAGHRQLFIDDHVIEEMEGFARALNQPVKYQGRVRLGGCRPRRWHAAHETVSL